MKSPRNKEPHEGHRKELQAKRKMQKKIIPRTK